MKGRKALPAAIKRMRGTEQKCRDREEIPTQKLVKVSVPKVLKSPRSRKIFRDKSKQLINLGLLADLDVDILSVYANSLDILYTCIEQMEKGKFKEVTDTEGNVVRFIPNPYLKLYKSMIETVNKIGSEFGFTPVSRLKLSGNLSQSDPDDADFN